MSHDRRHAGFRDVRAQCQDCGAEWFSPNAQGVAARHTDAHGHIVSVEISQHVTYYPASREKEALTA